jgi:hypothetical protein
MKMRRLFAIALVIFWPAWLAAQGIELHVHLPEDLKVSSAVAVNPELKSETRGTPADKVVTFPKLLPETTYNLELRLADGQILTGVDLGWYIPDDPEPEPVEPMTDDDRKEIQSIVADVPSFYDRTRLIHLSGTHARAVALVELIRERDFHSANVNVIWRVDVWYFQFQAGGWEKLQQQNKVLRRERFGDRTEYLNATKNLEWVPALGGVRLQPDPPVQHLRPSFAKTQP